MGLLEIIKNIVSGLKRFDITKLPTQGFFYPSDFEFRIKKAEVEHIIEYELNYKPDNVLDIIENIKNFVEKNIEFSKGYKFIDLKSVDIIFIFLDVVKLTNKKPIKISYFDTFRQKNLTYDFDSKFFKYFDFSKFMDGYSKESKSFEIRGYKFSMPSIGVENDLTNFLIRKIEDENLTYYNNLDYDFIFFLGDKNSLSDDEIENLIQIFNHDINDEEKLIIKSIVSEFQNLIGYSVYIDNRVIDLKSCLDLENIWK